MATLGKNRGTQNTPFLKRKGQTPVGVRPLLAEIQLSRW